MESSDFFLAQPSRRRKIKGPRPTPLDVCRDSHKITKNMKQPPPAPRRPVIIYTVSPKVIHADRREFMSLVQRLTGAPSSSSDTASLSSSSSFGDLRGGGVPSTGTARLARFERTTTSSHPSTVVSEQLAEEIDDAAMRTAAATGGVWSHIPEHFPVTQHPVNLFNELSLALHGMAETPILPYPARTSDHSFHF